MHLHQVFPCKMHPLPDQTNVGTAGTHSGNRDNHKDNDIQATQLVQITFVVMSRAAFEDMHSKALV